MKIIFLIKFGGTEGVSCSDEESLNIQNELQLCSQTTISSLYENIESITNIDSITKSLCDALSTINSDCVKNLERCFAAEDVKEMEETHMNSMKDFLISIVDAKVDRSSVDDCNKEISNDAITGIKTSIVTTESIVTESVMEDSSDEENTAELENENVNAEGTSANTTEKNNDSELGIKVEGENVSQPEDVSSRSETSDAPTVEIKTATMDNSTAHRIGTVSDTTLKSTTIEKVKTYQKASVKMTIKYTSKAEKVIGDRIQLVIVLGIISMYLN